MIIHTDGLVRLIPREAKDRSKISREVKNLSIYQSNEITQVYTAKYRNSEYIGRPCNGEVALSPKNNSMQLYLTREGLSSRTLPLEAARHIADHCGVTEPLHLNLLQAVLSELDVQRLQKTFAREGFFIDVDLKGTHREIICKHTITDLVQSYTDSIFRRGWNV